MTRMLRFSAAAALLALSGCAAPDGGMAAGGPSAGLSQSAGEAACRQALADFHSVQDVRIQSSEPYQGGGRFVRGSVRVSADGERELWQCIAYADGSTGEIAYLDRDPAGPAAPAQPGTGFDASVSNAAVDACVGALDARTDGRVEVTGTEFSQANSAVYMVVGPQRAPWRCLVSNDGQVAELMFTGNEGTL